MSSGAADPAEASARSVCSAVRAAVWTARAARILAGALPAATAGFVVAALLELDGAAGRPGAAACIVLAATLAAGASLAEHWPDERSLVRQLDVRRGLRGALLTFWERRAPALEGERFPRLLAERLQPSVRGLALARAGLPRQLAWIALPCAAAALWAWTLDRSPMGSARDAAAAEVERAARALLAQADARSAEPVRTPSTDPSRAEAGADGPVEAARALASEALELARGAEAGASGERLGPLARELARVGARPDATDLRGAFEPLRAAVERLRDLLPGAPTTAGPADGRGASASPGDARSGAGEGAADGAGGAVASSTRAPVDAPAAGAAARPPATTPADAGATSGTVAGGAWWDPRYDALVSSWIESRRRAP
jgi:hypothetical protein